MEVPGSRREKAEMGKGRDVLFHAVNLWPHYARSGTKSEEI